MKKSRSGTVCNRRALYCLSSASSIYTRYALYSMGNNGFAIAVQIEVESTDDGVRIINSNGADIRQRFDLRRPVSNC